LKLLGQIKGNPIRKTVIFLSLYILLGAVTLILLGAVTLHAKRT